MLRQKNIAKTPIDLENIVTVKTLNKGCLFRVVRDFSRGSTLVLELF